MKEASNLNFSDEANSTILKLVDFSPIVNFDAIEKKLDLMPDEYKSMEYLETVRTQYKAGAYIYKLEIKKRKKLHKYLKELNSSASALHAQSSQVLDVPRSPTTVNINASGVQVTVAGNIEAECYNQKV